MQPPEVTLETIRAARERIAGRTRRTPVLENDTLNALAGAQLYFKCENFQDSGAFKARGATNAVFALSAARAARRRGDAFFGQSRRGGGARRASARRARPDRDAGELLARQARGGARLWRRSAAVRAHAWRRAKRWRRSWWPTVAPHSFTPTTIRV